ncbi:hypothetical protein Clacol_009460 [Clathrus columnatus]|uniref:Uncharacterized protein n=1 Tax=Clathrus columnatus TaxID=1419009 RepID=A0AAV5APU4_9AGAM|nr:hypothetical protein Clacol_009460 [Clathrus columnatus]
MSWEQYEDKIVSKYHIVLDGWPAFTFNPTQLSARALETVIIALNAGSCRWKRLDREELEARQRERMAKIINGEIQIKVRKRRSDAGKKRNNREGLKSVEENISQKSEDEDSGEESGMSRLAKKSRTTSYMVYYDSVTVGSSFQVVALNQAWTLKRRQKKVPEVKKNEAVSPVFKELRPADENPRVLNPLSSKFIKTRRQKNWAIRISYRVENRLTPIFKLTSYDAMARELALTRSLRCRFLCLDAEPEVELIWSQRKNFETVLYAMARYSIMVQYSKELIDALWPNSSVGLNTCNVPINISVAAEVSSILGLRGILCTRAYALSSKKWLAAILLMITFLGDIILTIYFFTAQNLFGLANDVVVFFITLYELWGNWKLKGDLKLTQDFSIILLKQDSGLRERDSLGRQEDITTLSWSPHQQSHRSVFQRTSGIIIAEMGELTGLDGDSYEPTTTTSAGTESRSDEKAKRRDDS